MTQSYCSHVPTAAARPRLVLPCTPEDWSSGQIVNPGCEDVFFLLLCHSPPPFLLPTPLLPTRRRWPRDGGAILYAQKNTPGITVAGARACTSSRLAIGRRRNSRTSVPSSRDDSDSPPHSTRGVPLARRLRARAATLGLADPFPGAEQAAIRRRKRARGHHGRTGKRS